MKLIPPILIDIDAIEEAISYLFKSVFHNSDFETLVFTLYIWPREEIENLSDVSAFHFNL